MKTFARTADTHDIFLDTSGQIAMAESKVAHAQIIEAAILTREGELQLDTEKGIPYFDTVFLSPTLVDEWANAVSRRVSQIPFVTSIKSFDYELSGDTLTYTLEVETEEGDVTVSQLAYTNIIIPPGGGGSGGEQMETLVDSNGLFYLPVGKVGGIQRYRQLRQFDDGVGGVTTQLSDTQYIKDENGAFVAVQ